MALTFSDKLFKLYVTVIDEISITFSSDGSVDCRFSLSVRGVADEIYIYNSIVFALLH